MKQFMSIIICVSFFLCCGCSAQNDLGSYSQGSSTNSNTVADNEVSSVSEADVDISNSETQKIEVDENLLTVEITIPSFSGEVDSDFNPDEYIEENGFISAEQHEDGSITVKMTKTRHKQFLKEFSDAMNEAISEVGKDETTPYIKEIKTNSDFSEFDVYVDRDEYESNIDLSHLVLGFVGISYQQVSGVKDAKSHINIIDQSTNETIKTFDFPVE